MKAKALFLSLSLCALSLACSTAARAQGQTWQYTALGDSLAAGYYDAQGGYVPRFREHVEADTGNSVTLVNRGVPGWTSDDLLNALRNDTALRAQVAASRVVTFNIGGNDLLNALERYQRGTCGGADNQRCFGETMARLKSNWNAIIAQLLSLRGPADTVIRTMDIYNPAVALMRLYGVLHLLKPQLEEINRHLYLNATANRIPCARVYRAFNGPDGEEDAGARGLLSGDNIHPNSAGHQVIARELRSLGYQPLAGAASVVEFTTPVFVVAESEPRVTVTARRSTNTDKATTVEYSTADDPAAVPCNAATGTAYARCDYATTVDTLTFEPGETEKTFTVPIFNDAHVEGTETFQIRIDNAAGGPVVLRTTATVQIQDDDAGGAPNPVNDHAFFVRQQYLDFLSREPETSGFNAWMNVLNNCSNAFNHDPAAAAAACDRNTVSSGFFRSPEFQLKGFYVFNFYAATLGRPPQYAEVIADMRRVSGGTGEEVFARRAAFANAWVERQEFRAAYPDALSAAEFVNKLTQTAGVVLTGAVTKESLTADLQSRARTRSEVLQAFVEHPAVGAKFYNPAFVSMQYFGYLRRTPEASGYQAWLNYLTTHEGDFYTMVNGFVYSPEYSLRFGPQ